MLTALQDLDLPHFDYLDPELHGPRYHARLAELREHGWLARNEIAHFVLDREAGEHFLRSKATTFPGLEVSALFGVSDGPLADEMRRNILLVNGDDHRRLRNLVNPSFTPKAAARWRPAMREFLDRLWDELGGATATDAVASLAKPYPSLTIARVLGAPEADAPRLHHWSNWIQRQFDAVSLMQDREKIEEAVVELYDHLAELLERRRDLPGDDLISRLLEAHHEGDRLSHQEVTDLALDVLIGGVDTTQAQLSHALKLFAEHPDQWRQLAERPEELAPRAVTEVLRVEPITPFTARICLEDLELRGVAFPKGTIVMVCAETANREDGGPDFDITAERDGRRLLTFGAGPHYCLGANLARAELEEALAFLAPRMPGLRLDGEPRPTSITGIYSLETLPIAWD